MHPRYSTASLHIHRELDIEGRGRAFTHSRDTDFSTIQARLLIAVALPSLDHLYAYKISQQTGPGETLIRWNENHAKRCISRMAYKAVSL